MDMMYMDDAIEAIIQLMEADGAKLETRNGYNLSAMSIDPEMVKEAIQEHYPDFTLDYDVDPVREGLLKVGQIVSIQVVHVENGVSILNMI